VEILWNDQMERLRLRMIKTTHLSASNNEGRDALAGRLYIPVGANANYVHINILIQVGVAQLAFQMAILSIFCASISNMFSTLKPYMVKPQCRKS